MKPAKDVNELYQQDPSAFESNVMSLVEQAVPASEYMTQSPSTGICESDRQGDDEIEVASSRFDVTRDRVSLDELLAPSEPRTFIVHGRLPQDAGTLVGPGGGNKTTIALWEAIHIILGKPLYGQDVLKPGGVIFLSQEDERPKLIWRASKLVEALGLTREEIEHVAKNLFVPDFGGNRLRLVEADARLNLYRTDVVNELIDAYSDADVSFIVVDPLTYFGPGERFMNDGGAETMSAGRQIAHALNCCVEFISHTSMATARSKPDDSYTARGAAAISDNGRFTRNLWTFAETDRERFGDPPGVVTADDIAGKCVLVMSQPKLSDGPPVTDLTWLIRRVWTIEWLENEHRSASQIEADDVRQLHAFLVAEETRGNFHTARTIEESHHAVGVSRNRLRALIEKAEKQGWVTRVEIPKGHPFRQGSRTHRLAPGVLP